ncbi:sensor domain-containing protein [Streptomyces sp. XM83C]|jgi:signal transduction histidine kinase|uniref:sensor histidine kinase n=1 Tax=unclassified Streptomyces TaxID=2593676 RepID=UPI001FF711FB|nr:sensor domain-containing protein [Streptomyces sp. XM83C]MCK1821104.1 sensor domain-containing protein [Streptomyces sp. XM83C]
MRRLARPIVPRPADTARRLRALAAAPFRPRALAAALYAVLALPLALAGFLLTLAGLAAGLVLSVTALGPWLLAATVRATLALGAVQRALVRRLLGLDIEAPEPQRPRGALDWRRAVLTGRAGRRAAGCALLTPFTAALACAAVLAYVYGVLLALHPLLAPLNNETRRAPDGTTRQVSLEFLGQQVDTWPRWLIPVCLGLLLLAAAPHLVRHALVPHRAVLASLLGPSADERRIRALEETRAHAVEDAAATLRRIERDLHDGTQARLVGLAMHLTLIRELVGAGADRDRVLAAVDAARGNAGQAITELRRLVKGIHPPVLDEGLPAALASLTADSALPVTLTTDLCERPAPAVESIVYFCTAELLTNAAKHSGATSAAVQVTARDGRLNLRVSDDGRGGAVIGAGSGLTGLLARVRTVDGTMTCDSPPGGPTVITVELPTA